MISMTIMKDEVVAFRLPGTQEPYWKVVFSGRLMPPDFQVKGAAMAYLARLRGKKQDEEDE